MNKKLFAVLCIAVLVLSFASARVANFSIGPSFGTFSGKAPIDDDGHTVNYKGNGFGVDSTLSFNFNDKAELYIQDSFLFSGKSFYPDYEIADNFFKSSLHYTSIVGFEYAVVTDPVKLSVGGGFAVEILYSTYEMASITYMPMVVNFGFDATVKAELELGKSWSLYVKTNADFVPGTVFVNADSTESEDKKADAAATGNFSFAASAGIVVFF